MIIWKKEGFEVRVMWRQWYGSETIMMLIFAGISIGIGRHLFLSKTDKVLTISFVSMVIGFCMMLVGVGYIRGFDGMGWFVYGLLLYGGSLLVYLTFTIFRLKQEE